MAKLKIFRANNSTANKPSKAGYRRVVEKLKNQDNFEEFLMAEPDERVTLLLEYLENVVDDDNTTRNMDVFHELKGGTSEQISEKNCEIQIVFDKRKVGKRSKHTMAFPNYKTPDPSYLGEYVKAIVELYNNGPAGAGPGIAAASDFLYGIMLLTRCR